MGTNGKVSVGAGAAAGAPTAPDPEELVARSIERALAQQEAPGAVLLTGPPGAGKTSFASRLARRLGGARLVYHQLHSWCDDQELFCGVDVRAAVAGEAQHVRQPGVLAVAAAATADGLTVLVLDEIDKASDRTEFLLLDFLETGRVPIRPGEHVLADRKRLITVLTSNDTRPVSDALLRRVRRVRLSAMPQERLVAIVADQLPDVPVGIVRMLARLACPLAEADNASLTVPELLALVQDCAYSARSHQEVRAFLAQWAARGTQGADQAQRAQTAGVWAEITQWRRRRGV